MNCVAQFGVPLTNFVVCDVIVKGSVLQTLELARHFARLGVLSCAEQTRLLLVVKSSQSDLVNQELRRLSAFASLDTSSLHQQHQTVEYGMLRRVLIFTINCCLAERRWFDLQNNVKVFGNLHDIGGILEQIRVDLNFQGDGLLYVELNDAAVCRYQQVQPTVGVACRPLPSLNEASILSIAATPQSNPTNSKIPSLLDPKMDWMTQFWLAKYGYKLPSSSLSSSVKVEFHNSQSVFTYPLCALWSAGGLVKLHKESRDNAAKIYAHIYSDLVSIGQQLGFFFDSNVSSFQYAHATFATASNAVPKAPVKLINEQMSENEPPTTINNNSSTSTTQQQQSTALTSNNANQSATETNVAENIARYQKIFEARLAQQSIPSKLASAATTALNCENDPAMTPTVPLQQQNHTTTMLLNKPSVKIPSLQERMAALQKRKLETSGGVDAENVPTSNVAKKPKTASSSKAASTNGDAEPAAVFDEKDFIRRFNASVASVTVGDLKLFAKFAKLTGYSKQTRPQLLERLTPVVDAMTAKLAVTN